MKLVTYNIQYGKGQDGQVNLDRIASEIEGADIISLQEIDRYWARTNHIDQLSELTSRFPEHHWVFGAGVDLHVENSHPNEHKRRQFGNLIMSRYPILASRHHLLPKYGSTGSDLSIQRSAIEATIRCNQHFLRIYSVHLTHLSSETRLPQLEALMNIHNNARFEGAAIAGDLTGFDWQKGGPSQEVPEHAIIMGDFNFQPDSDEYAYIAGPISDYGGHITNPIGFVDAWCEMGNDKMSGQTSDVHDIPARLDYCFVSTPLREKIVNCTVNNSAKGSDHLPVWIDIED